MHISNFFLAVELCLREFVQRFNCKVFTGCLFFEIGTPGGPKTIHRVGDQPKMLSDVSDVPIYLFSYHLWMVSPKLWTI